MLSILLIGDFFLCIIRPFSFDLVAGESKLKEHGEIL